MWKTWFVTGALLAALAVVLGAFGAHGLKDAFPDATTAEQSLRIFETGARYHMYHALGLLVCGLLIKSQGERRLLKSCGWLFLIGIFLFSGSLYLLSTIEITGLQSWKSFIGPLTPIGGLCFIAGWICLAAGAFRNKNL